MSVDHTGEMPRITVDVPELLALGLMLQSKREELGDTHPDTLKLAHRYAVAMADHPERHDDAIGLMEWLVSVRPDDTEDRLLTLNDLSRLLRGARRLARAAEVLLQALDGWERHRGPDDQNTLSAAHNLAVVLIDLGRADDARGLLRDTVARRARVLGPSHHDTVRSRDALAGTLRGNPARLNEAERMYGQILADIGDDRSELAQGIRHNLASVLFHQGKLADAEAAFRQVLSGRAQTLGDEHPSFLITRSNLAAVLNARGRLAESEGHTRAVLAVQRRVLGPAHPDSLDSQVNLATRVASPRPCRS